MHDGSSVQSVAQRGSSANASDEERHSYLSAAFPWLFQGPQPHENKKGWNIKETFLKM